MNIKPQKPSADFPLYAHASGKWAKKIAGKIKYFGSWADPSGAMLAYQELVAGRVTDSLSSTGLTVKEGADKFLNAKHEAMKAGIISQSTFSDYRRTCKWLADRLGRSTTIETLSPPHFSAYKDDLATRRSVISLGNEITRVRVLFKWLWDARLIKAPIHFGPDFKRPPKKVLRRHRRTQGKKLFTAEEIRLLLDECGVHLRALVLLGINCGFVPTDCATVPAEAFDLNSGWVDYPRPKTEVERRIPLWPETVAAVKASLSRRPVTDKMSAFVLPDGRPWDHSGNPVTKYTRQALSRAGIRRGSFYWLRHGLQTIGDEARDAVAVKALMGHVDGSMSATYREGISDERLLAVTNHVRDWLFG